jgi:hypothetical protein
MKKQTLNKNWYGVIALAGTLAISIGVFAYSGNSPKNVIEGDYIEAPEMAPVVEEELGAMPGNELFTEEFTVNGVTKIYYSNTTGGYSTTTPCAYKVLATSSIESLDLIQTSGTSSPLTLQIATGTTAYATTTVFATRAVAANINYPFSYRPPEGTAGVGEEATLLKPGTWILFTTASSNSKGGTFGGAIVNVKCQAVLRKLK